MAMEYPCVDALVVTPLTIIIASISSAAFACWFGRTWA